MNREAWKKRLLECGSHERIGALRRIWRFISQVEQPDALTWALSNGDLPVNHIVWLWGKLLDLRQSGRRIFDCDRARDEFENLTDRITIYRGTVEAELKITVDDDRPNYGVSWTLNRERAVWFATTHGRFRNTDSPPVLLTTEIAKTDASGYFVERDEAEVLVGVDVLWRSAPYSESLTR